MKKENKVLNDDNLKNVNGGSDNEPLRVVDGIPGKLENGDLEVLKDAASNMIGHY